MENFCSWMAEAVQKDMKVMILPWPKMQKMGLDKIAPEEVKKGAYLDASKFDFAKPNFKNAILNGKFFESGSISPGFITNTGIKMPPEFKVKDETNKYKSLSELKNKGTRLIKINMITNQGNNKKWKWHSFAKGYKPSKDYYQITSVQMGDHYFCLDLFIWTPFLLENYAGGEPRNRPTTYGNLSLGMPVGEVVISGNKPRTLYSSIAII